MVVKRVEERKKKLGCGPEGKNHKENKREGKKKEIGCKAPEKWSGKGKRLGGKTGTRVREGRVELKGAPNHRGGTGIVNYQQEKDT